MPTPKPGSRVRGSQSGRPIMALLDLLGRRWALRVIWELREKPLTFRELRTRCDEMSPSVLNARLAELRDAGILTGERGVGYQLTKNGQDLLGSLKPLRHWANAWARRAHS